MNKISGIYKITSPSGKIYIGQSKNIHGRLLKYQRSHCKTQTKLYRSILKYGWENHNFEVIHKCDPCDLNTVETKYISFYNSTNKETGLNLNSGGKKDYKVSDETREKNRINSAGKNNPMFNKKHSDEAKEKIRQKAFNRICSEETKRKMSEKKLNIPFTKEHKENMRKNNFWSKPVCAIINGKLETFISASEASRVTGIKQKTILMGISRNSKRSKSGILWKLA